MLTNNFKKLILCSYATQTGIDTKGEQKQLRCNLQQDNYYGADNLLTYPSICTSNYFINELTYPLDRVTTPLHNAYYLEGNLRLCRLGMLIGTGDTPPTIDDYKLTSQIEIPNSFGADSCQVNGDVIICTREFINTLDSSLVIKEIGLYVLMVQRNSADPRIFLIARKLLDQPVTIEVGKSATFTYNLDMSTIISGNNV